MSKKRYEWINGETYCDSDQMYDNETGNKTQPVYVADLLNEQDQKIKSLERKVSDAEQEKERIRKNWQISKTHQQKLYNNLKQQNKAKGIVNYPITLDGCRIANEEQLLDFAKDFCLEKKYWQEQLEEKDKEISKWKNKKGKYVADRLTYISNIIAIQELEKVKKMLKHKGFVLKVKPPITMPTTPMNEYLNEFMILEDDFDRIFDQQIKLLKGEK